MAHGGGGQEGGGDVEGHLVVTGVDCLALNLLGAGHVNHESSDRGSEEGRESSNTGQDAKCGGQWRQTEHVNLENVKNEIFSRMDQSGSHPHAYIIHCIHESKNQNLILR